MGGGAAAQPPLRRPAELPGVPDNCVRGLPAACKGRARVPRHVRAELQACSPRLTISFLVFLSHSARQCKRRADNQDTAALQLKSTETHWPPFDLSLDLVGQFKLINLPI